MENGIKDDKKNLSELEILLKPQGLDLENSRFYDFLSIILDKNSNESMSIFITQKLSETKCFRFEYFDNFDRKWKKKLIPKQIITILSRIRLIRIENTKIYISDRLIDLFNKHEKHKEKKLNISNQ